MINNLKIFNILFLIMISFLSVNSTNNIDNTDITGYTIDTYLVNTTNTSCKLCRSIVNIIKYELNVSNKSITEIEKVVRDLCIILGNKVQKKECFNILSMINNIIEMIISGLEPGEICTKLGFCNTYIMKYINISLYF